ncbi:MAG TPA: hypothetical protein VF447_17920, partial [Terriglobales bacterium]
MPAGTETPESVGARRGLWPLRTALTLSLVAAVILVVSVYDAGSILRGRVVQTLSDRFNSRVEMRDFHVTFGGGLHVAGADLRIYGDSDPNSHQPGQQPLISIANFSFRISIWNLLRAPTHVDTVVVRGLSLNIPPKNQRKQISGLHRRSSKAKVRVDHFECDHAELVINTSTPEKLPLVFDIQNL